jgi:hypothetical protein
MDNFLHKRFALPIICLILLGGIATGCASTGVTKIQKPPVTRIGGSSSLAVNVSSQVPGAEDVVAQLESTIVGQLRARQMFERVYSAAASAGQPAELALVVTVTKIRRVDAGSRSLLGALAGQGEVIVQVDLVNGHNSALLASATIEGKTSGGTIFAGTTPQAAERVTEQVVDFVVSNL